MYLQLSYMCVSVTGNFWPKLCIIVLLWTCHIYCRKYYLRKLFVHDCMHAFLSYQPIPVSVLAVEDISDGEARIGGSFRGTLKNSSSTGQQPLPVHIIACPPYLYHCFFPTPVPWVAMYCNITPIILLDMGCSHSNSV